ncbi:replication initiation factor domain-containing protein [Geobacter sp. AOG2]|uniref:replication initiation factor domain-containing protein n=1 Tax=Geobacter sp. AOG2 TaxID=1566347 RepID=UPI001CC59090|nr:replication initiation factor domain-containing protein [Geobacter sp. AOG2]GFE60622.1 putative DNA relaxase NicK [Geobacter sp. AOG2]
MKTYHDSDLVATGQSSLKKPGFPAGLAGSAGNPGGKPEPPTGGTNEAQPPLTNRGALITTPLLNQFLIDWVAFTVKIIDPQEILQIIGLKSELFSELDRGLYGYQKSLRFGNICVYFAGRPDMGCHVTMSGQGCRQYESQFPKIPWFALFATAITFKAKFTRLDIAHDNVDGALDLAKLKEAIINREIRSRFRKASETQNFDLSPDIEQSTDGHTLYFGKRSSRVFLRFYDKAAQLGLPFVWNRAELELKDKRAHEAAKYLSSGVPVGQLFIGILNQYLSVVCRDDSNTTRCSIQPWWSAWLQTVEKIKLTTAQEIKTVDEVMQYVKRQYAPSLAMIKTHLGATIFGYYIRELLKDGSERMGMKHEQILRVSSKGKADNYDEGQEKFEERAAIIEYDGGLDRTDAEELARRLLDQEDQP